MENTPDLNWGSFDPDQVGGITTKVLGSDGNKFYFDGFLGPIRLEPPNLGTSPPTGSKIRELSL